MTPFGYTYLDFISTVTPGSKFRLAPTPSGFLHTGNAFNFILNWAAARIIPGASLLLRIDDLDAGRKRPEFVADIFDTLWWLGLDYDTGPVSLRDFEQNWSQRLRLPVYRQALDALRASGRLFACAKSRQDLAPFGGSYPEAFRRQHLSLDAPGLAWRIQTPETPVQNLPADFVVRRKDALPAYQLASLLDDLNFGITHIIRGEDLLGSTAAQHYLAACLNTEAFQGIRFLHHPLILDEQGAKLSKSAGSAAMKHWREAGRHPSGVFQLAAANLGLPAQTIESAVDFLDMLRQIKPKHA